MTEATSVKTYVLTLINEKSHCSSKKKKKILRVNIAIIDLLLSKRQLIVDILIRIMRKLVLITSKYDKMENHV